MELIASKSSQDDPHSGAPLQRLMTTTTTYYGPDEDAFGQGTSHRDAATFYDAKGNYEHLFQYQFVDQLLGRDGAFQHLSRAGDSTRLYDGVGRYRVRDDRATARFGSHTFRRQQ